MMRHILFYFSISALTLISGCGELTYKQGASVRDLDQAKQACKYANEANIEQCLEKNGWYVQKLDDVDLFATVSATDNRNSQPLLVDVTQDEANVFDNNDVKTKPDIPTDVEPVKTKSVQISQKMNEDTNQQANPITQQDDKKALKPIASNKIQEKPVNQKPIDPHQKYKISSWWKMGSGESKLRKDFAACTSQLGESHAPDMTKQMYTRGFVVCMHELGWKALKAYQ